MTNGHISAGAEHARCLPKLRQPPAFVSKCETGERRIDPIELEIFARLYRKPIRYFYEKG